VAPERLGLGSHSPITAGCGGWRNGEVAFILSDGTRRESDEDSVLRGVEGRCFPLQQAIDRQRFTGIHAETAIFIAAGGTIAIRSDRNPLSALHVAPLIAYLAVSPIPSDLEGELPVGWIKSA